MVFNSLTQEEAALLFKMEGGLTLKALKSVCDAEVQSD